jgi:hypothetical protein
MNKLSSIFQNNGLEPSRSDAQASHESKPQPNESHASSGTDKPIQPAESGRTSSTSRLGEKMTFIRAKALLNQAAASAANSFVGLLQNQTTSADVLRRTLEEVIEYRAAESALSLAADESAFRTIGADPARNLVRMS